MAEVERLLMASLVEFAVVDPDAPAARFCLGEYYGELERRFEGGFKHAMSIAAGPEQLRLPAGLFVAARLRGEPVGCVALKFHGSEPAELKRMWVALRARGLGLGRRLLDELERLAREHGVSVLRLETNRALTEAIALYRSSGYHEVPAFNDEPYAHHWFEKRLRLEAPAICRLHPSVHAHARSSRSKSARTRKRRCAALLQSPLTDSNRQPPPYHPGTGAGRGGTRESSRARERRKPGGSGEEA